MRIKAQRYMSQINYSNEGVLGFTVLCTNNITEF